MEVCMGGKRVVVASLKEASVKWNEYRIKKNLRASRMHALDGQVWENGQLIATVSYNGRVWKGGLGTEEIKV